MSTVFRAEDEPLASRFDYWRHVITDRFGAFELRAPEVPDFRDWLQAHELGPVQVVDAYVDRPESQGDRSTRHVRQSANELCGFTIQTHGRTVVEQHGRQAVLYPGDLAVLDLAQTCRVAGGQSRATRIVFPRTLFPLHADDLARATAVRVPGDRGLGRVASSLAHQVPAELDDEAAGAHATRIGTAILDLLTVAVASHVDRDRVVPVETRQRALVPRIRAFIEEHLADPGLSPATVAAAHFVSARYLHKLFEAEETTVADLIRRRRLERCRQDLLDPTLGTTTVAAIGARWGFTDPAHFSRLFRSTHGMPPGTYRRIAGRAGTR